MSRNKSWFETEPEWIGFAALVGVTSAVVILGFALLLFLFTSIPLITTICIIAFFCWAIYATIKQHRQKNK